jgi:N-methylhydantoinase A
MLVMQASGGLTSVLDATRQPIVTLDSGPTGGVLGSQSLGRLYGEQDLICTDVGGTSFDVGLVQRGQAPLDAEPVVGQYSLRFPKILVRSIGSGGGSIAWLDPSGRLRVGPQSAGSAPGPVCYGRGGTEPTVTDADLVLGHVSADAFLGGRMRLDRDAALRAMATLGEALRMEAEEVAVGISRIINAQMADLIRTSTIERGVDPRTCVVVAYGGAGPTHAVGYAQDIGSRAILVPAMSTVFSAAGLLTCDVTHTAELSRRIVSPYDERELAEVDERFAVLERRVLEQFAREGSDAGRVQLVRSLGLRFRQQVHTLEIPVPAGGLDHDGMESLIDRFTEEYARVYGPGALLGSRDTELELHRVVGTLPIEELPLHRHEPAGEDPGAARKGSRPAHFDGLGFVDTPVFDGERLAHGNVLQGPAIVERMGDSVVLPGGFRATVDAHLTLRIEPEAGTVQSTPTAAGAERAPA